MDKNNVLSFTLDLDKLDKDFYNWSLLSYNIRKVSDDNCMKLYGCKNRELYNKIKQRILLNKPIDNEILVQSNNKVIVDVHESYDYDSINRRDLIMRISLAKQMNSNDVLTAIIYPYDPELINDNSYKDNYKIEFNEIYNRFIRLSDKYQKYSNLYSIQLFGYNVRSMYQLIYPDLYDNNTDVINRDYLNSYVSYVEESNTENIIDKNIISLYKCKILHCMDSINEASTDGIFARMLENELTSILIGDNCKNDIKLIIPYFTISEYNSIVDDSSVDYDRTIVDSINTDNEYFKTINELYNKFIASNNTDTYIENTLLKLGWNPYVNPRTSMNKVKERHIKWFNEHCAHIIDLSNIDITHDNNKTLLESTYENNKLYKENNIYPVYIVLSYTNTTFGKIIRKVKSSTFTHAGITLDSNLNQILTFEFNDKNNKGFMVESIKDYINRYDNALISVLCLFVDSNILSKLQDSISYFISNKSKTKYNFKNLINILRNKSKDNDPYNLSLVCSQFVDTILKLVNIDITNKSSNLVIPQDFENISHPKVYKLYNGLAREYNEVKIEDMIYTLISNSNIEDISYNTFISEVCNSDITFLSHRYNIIDNSIANNILQEFYKYIDIECI